MLNKKSVDDINVKGKKVLCRCDFNVPLIDGKITDENRLVAALPTIKKLIADGGRVILCSHLGKPKGEPKPELSLAPVAVRLSELLDQEVKFVPSDVVVDDSVKAAVDAMKDGEVILLQNTRYRAEETERPPVSCSFFCRLLKPTKPAAPRLSVHPILASPFSVLCSPRSEPSRKSSLQLLFHISPGSAQPPSLSVYFFPLFFSCIFCHDRSVFSIRQPSFRRTRRAPRGGSFRFRAVSFILSAFRIGVQKFPG